MILKISFKPNLVPTNVVSNTLHWRVGGENLYSKGVLGFFNVILVGIRCLLCLRNGFSYKNRSKREKKLERMALYIFLHNRFCLYQAINNVENKKRFLTEVGLVSYSTWCTKKVLKYFCIIKKISSRLYVSKKTSTHWYDIFFLSKHYFFVNFYTCLNISLLYWNELSKILIFILHKHHLYRS